MRSNRQKELETILYRKQENKSMIPIEMMLLEKEWSGTGILWTKYWEKINEYNKNNVIE